MAMQTAGTEQRDPVGNGGPRAEIAARTLRTDRWWIQPLVTAIVFTAFVVYATWAAFDHTQLLRRRRTSRRSTRRASADGCPSAIAWAHCDIWHWLSPALYILIFPLSFRATCYYYRKAYYRSFWLSPPACAVSEPHKKYTGETRFPLIFQNIHRYTWYFAVIFAGILTYDAGPVVLLTSPPAPLRDRRRDPGARGQRRPDPGLHVRLPLVPTHHRQAGSTTSPSIRCATSWWTLVSKLNRRHMQWAWASLVWIAVADLYIRLVANGTITDYHHIF